MVKVKFTAALDESTMGVGFLGSGTFGVNEKGTKAFYNDFGGMQIELRGKGFETDFIGLGLTDGSIKGAKVVLGDETLANLQGSISMKTFNQAIGTGDLEEMFAKLLARKDDVSGSNGDDAFIRGFNSNDTLKGLGGDDTLNGGAGNDTLSGGAGNDSFEFDTGFGKDRITDFDADGGVGAQDLIHILGSLTTFEVRQDADGNAVIWLSDNDTLTLVGVAAAQIDSTDFAA